MSHPLVATLIKKCNVTHGCRFIDKESVVKFINNLLKILYPSLGRCMIRDEQSLIVAIRRAEIELSEMVGNVLPHDKAEEVTKNFFNNLVALSEELDSDAKAIYDGDPAARSIDEVVSCYPGFFGIFVHRIANLLYKDGVPIFPRLFSEYAHQITGIDIHPGATIGKNFFIDHGTGVVIGETTIIGNNVKIYQGVTLGALSVDKKLQNIKRHPTIGDNCVIYSNATLLGGDTVIGENSVIGGNVWITKSIPANSTVYHSIEIKMKTQKE